MITMSERDTHRLGVLERVKSGHLSQVQAGLELGLSTRQVRRLLTRYERQGARGLVHCLRGRPSNRRTPQTVLDQARQLISTYYADFGPTLASEKLLERHGIALSVEHTRGLMTQAGLWHPKRRRNKALHPLRERRACRGELIQIDGSPHDWFEGRAPRCTLLVFIDDATSELMALRFVEQETTRDYLSVLHQYILTHGLPACLYSDRHSIFVTNHGQQEHVKPTRFHQALQRLGIEAIQANSPQAKGRVERANQTLQDRLVKEMRLAGINGMQQANAWLEAFRRAHNQRFAVAPDSTQDAHVPYLSSPQGLVQACSIHYERVLSRALSCQLHGKLLQIQAPGQQRQLAGKRVQILEHPDGQLTLLYKNASLPFEMGPKSNKPRPVDAKQLNDVVTQKIDKRERNRRPAPDTHPWKRWISTEPNPRLQATP